MATAPDSYIGWTQPESAANTEAQPEYPFNNMFQSDSGHTFEMDDTKDRERIRLNHRAGTFIEMAPNGDMVQSIQGDGYEIIAKDKRVLVKGTCFLTVEGDCNLHVMGDKIEYVEGNYEQHVKGDYTRVVEGLSNITSVGDMQLKAGTHVGGSLMITTGGNIMLNSSVHVKNELTALKMYSETRVDAGYGISAGPAGFVTTSGGVAVGLPVAVPTQVLVSGLINAGGPISSAVSVNAPLGNFGFMDAIMMSDIVNSTVFDTHIHPTPKGPSGTPTTNFT